VSRKAAGGGTLVSRESAGARKAEAREKASVCETGVSKSERGVAPAAVVTVGLATDKMQQPRKRLAELCLKRE